LIRPIISLKARNLRLGKKPAGGKDNSEESNSLLQDNKKKRRVQAFFILALPTYPSLPR
jgi:hypothetical protein